MSDEFNYELAFRRLRARGEVKIIPSQVSLGYGPLQDLPGGRRGQVHLGWAQTVKIEFTPHRDSPEQAKRKRDWYRQHGKIGPFMAGFFFSEHKQVERPTMREALEELLEATRPATGYLDEMVVDKLFHEREQDAQAAIWDAVAIGVIHGEYAA